MQARDIFDSSTRVGGLTHAGDLSEQTVVSRHRPWRAFRCRSSLEANETTTPLHPLCLRIVLLSWRVRRSCKFVACVRIAQEPIGFGAQIVHRGGPSRRREVRLAAEDAFFREIRDLHIDRLGPLLQEKAQAIQRTFAEKDTKKSSEMSEYVERFKTAQWLRGKLEIHINLAHDLRAACV